jgi:Cu/Ag efflux protein CusF
MIRRSLLTVFLVLGLASSATAQMGPGGGGGMGGGRGHGNRGGQPSSSPSSDAKPSSGPSKPETPVTEVDIFGVIQAIDPQTQRITIAYEANDGLNLPRGETPFEVAKTDLMQGRTVGEKVRFRLDSHQISFIAPYQQPADGSTP